MPGFLITNTGTAAFIAAGGLGPKVDISHFRIGPDSTAEGYIPAVTDLDIPTPLTSGYGLPANGYLPVVNYVAVDDTHAAYTLRMDQSIGTFDFGSLALYQETAPLTYVCVAVYAFDSKIKKQVLTMTDVGNVIEITATLELANINNLTINVAIVAPAPANMVELASPDQLTIPSVAPVNTYILNGTGSPYGLDTEGNSIIAYKTDTDFWTYSTHLHEFYTGTVTSSTATSLTDLSLGTTLTTGFAIGMYIVVFTTGAHKGVSRMVTAVGTNTIGWFTSTGAAVSPGDTYSVYIANVEFSGGTTSGSNTYKLVVASPLQTVFDTFPVLAEQMTCYFGAGFQPPSDYVITPSDPYEITFGVGVPGGTRVHFLARTLDYSTVIPGGTTGQALIKNSNTSGDYSWTTLSSGSNNYLKVTAVDSGDGYQYVFNIAPVYADSALVFSGAGFQPPEVSVYSITGVNQITFAVGSGIPAGVDVFFVEKVTAYLGIIPGGNTGQVLSKNSATDGDYSWITDPGAVPAPANPTDDAKVLTATGGSFAWAVSYLAEVYCSYSAGNVNLNVYNGGRITIDNVVRTLPGTLTLPTSGTSYRIKYVYAYWTGAAVAIETSTVAPTWTGTIIRYKGGDSTRTWVGVASMDGAGTLEFVRSAFGRRYTDIRKVLAADTVPPANAAAYSVALITAAAQLVTQRFLVLPGERVRVSGLFNTHQPSGTVTINTGLTYATTPGGGTYVLIPNSSIGNMGQVLGGGGALRQSTVNEGIYENNTTNAVIVPFSLAIHRRVDTGTSVLLGDAGGNGPSSIFIQSEYPRDMNESY